MPHVPSSSFLGEPRPTARMALMGSSEAIGNSMLEAWGRAVTMLGSILESSSQAQSWAHAGSTHWITVWSPRTQKPHLLKENLRSRKEGRRMQRQQGFVEKTGAFPIVTLWRHWDSAHTHVRLQPALFSSAAHSHSRACVRHWHVCEQVHVVIKVQLPP